MCTCQSRHVDTLIHVHKKLLDTLCTTILLHFREAFELCVGSLYAPSPRVHPRVLMPVITR